MLSSEQAEQASVTNGNLVVSSTGKNEMTFTRADTSKTLLTIKYTFAASSQNCSYNCSNTEVRTRTNQSANVLVRTKVLTYSYEPKCCTKY